MEHYDKQQQKVENWISHCIFKSCAEGFRVFFHARALIFHQTPCIYLLNSRGGRQTSDFNFAHLSEHPNLKFFSEEILISTCKVSDPSTGYKMLKQGKLVCKVYVGFDREI